MISNTHYTNSAEYTYTKKTFVLFSYSRYGEFKTETFSRPLATIVKKKHITGVLQAKVALMFQLV